MRAIVQVNRSQYDAMPVVVLPVDRRTYADAIPIGTEVHVFTDAELRARDERIIRATAEFIDPEDGWCCADCRDAWYDERKLDVPRIIAAAEADQ